MALICGDGGNRTRVRRPAKENIYIHSLLIDLAAATSIGKGCLQPACESRHEHPGGARGQPPELTLLPAWVAQLGKAGYLGIN